MQHYFTTIQGWFCAHDLYTEMVRAAPDTPCNFIELGAWKGRSTSYLGVEIVNSGKPIQLIVVDHFKGSGETEHNLDPDLPNLYNVFLDNMRPLIEKGLQLSVVRDSTHNAVLTLPDSFFTFIDASHKYEDVKKDIDLYWPKTTHMLAGDDWNWSGVERAVMKSQFFRECGGVHVNNTVWFGSRNEQTTAVKFYNI
jgi:hypothetical protein